MIHRTTCAMPVCLLVFGVDAFALPSRAFAQDAVDVAVSLIGRPYVWGAEGPDAFDCSGLTQYVYQEFGVDLPRRAISQSRIGEPVGKRLRRGDLLFFSTDTRQSLVTHVALYEGDGTMIEASKRYGRVRRDSLSDPYWVERFLFARRIGSSSAARELPDRRNARDDDPPRRTSDRHRTALRVLEHVAGALIELSRRR